MNPTRLLALLTLVLLNPAMAESPAESPLPLETKEARDARMGWWREARFGMFVHWGLYSGLAGNWEGKPTPSGSEAAQLMMKLDSATYAKAALPLFQPKPGFAKEWAKLAKAAGCRYLVFTTKHHEGFALHDSKVSDFDADSLLQRDLVDEIVTACREEGLRIGFYHSLIDWHHDQYAYADSALLHHPLKGKPYPNGARDHAKYLDYMHAQVKEVVSNYGQVDVLWWDYSAPDFDGQEAWRAFDLMKMVREKQPQVIMNNRLFRRDVAGWDVKTGASGSSLDTRYGDFITPEQHIPEGGMSQVDWETCMTMNTSWGYCDHNKDWKSSSSLIRKLVDIASKGGNYLLNVGPMGNGEIPQESVERLQDVGRWMQANGESIYGTTANPLEKTPFDGRVTRKGDTLYLHLFAVPENGVIELPVEAKSATWLASGEALRTEKRGNVLRIHTGTELPVSVDSVIRLER